MLKYNQILR